MALLSTAAFSAVQSRQVIIAPDRALASDSVSRHQRKCFRSLSALTCMRCAERDLPCTYKQAQRGRKRGYIVKAAERKGVDSSLQLPSHAHSGPLVPSSILSSTPQSAQALGHGSVSFSREGPVEAGPSSPFRHQTPQLHQTRRSSSDPPATHFSLSRITEGSGKPTSAVDGHNSGSLATAFGGIRASKYQSLPATSRFGSIQDPLTAGLFLEFEVDALFAL